MKSNNVRESLLAFLVKNEGQYDLSASMEKFEATAKEYIASHQADHEVISTCLTAVFAKHPGATLNQLFITSEVVAAMKAGNKDLSDPTLHSFLTKRVHSVLKDEIAAGFYETARGPNGGTKATGKVRQ